MAQVIFPFSDLEAYVEGSMEEAMEELTMLGFPSEKTEDGQLNVEVTPNRPDALCIEGIARTRLCYRNGKPKPCTVRQSGLEVKVDGSVADVRPYFGGALVKGVRITDSSLRSLMQLQEKLHETLGRKRRKVAIGIHDADRVRPPFRYFACGLEEVSFVPLEQNEKMTPNEILRRHAKGMGYAHLVGEKCPMIEDAACNILSFPPIINGELTKLTTRTENIVIDATGTSQETVLQAVNIVAGALDMLGGAVEQIMINGKHYPVLQERRWPLPVKESARLLGIELSNEQISSLLLKMGYRVEGNFAFSPGHRADVMNEVDLIEDIAIAYGYNNFEPRLPSFVTYGKIAPVPAHHQVMVGLGFDEVVSWTLSNHEKEARTNLPDGECIEIENPLTEDFTMFRRAILPNLLSILAEGKSESLPIKIYEIGPVADSVQRQSLSFASMHAKASFSEIKGHVQSMFETLGVNAQFKEDEFGPFIPGRCASVIVNGQKIGNLGEISPDVLCAFNLEQPVCACEISLSS
ncbi:MAG: phenylalanine--tRNA ligase subunit beta [Candidatus Micrarchaeota archaeon]|nr:phenylalanine--tRNA ligase subunit beta [Candidatus Micrarchaeota archaeon]